MFQKLLGEQNLRSTTAPSQTPKWQNIRYRWHHWCLKSVNYKLQRRNSAFQTSLICIFYSTNISSTDFKESKIKNVHLSNFHFHWGRSIAEWEEFSGEMLTLLLSHWGTEKRKIIKIAKICGLEVVIARPRQGKSPLMSWEK